jgi:hypothetical protein
MLTAAPDYHGALNLLGAILIPLENTFMTVRLFDFSITRQLARKPINDIAAPFHSHLSLFSGTRETYGCSPSNP